MSPTTLVSSSDTSSTKRTGDVGDALGGKRNMIRSRNNNGWDDEMSPLVASLSGMVNIEALMAAANETDERMDLIMPNMNDLKSAIEISEVNAATASERETSSSSSSSSSSILFPFLDNALRWNDFAKNVQYLSDLILDDKKGMNISFDELVNMVPNEEFAMNNEASESFVPMATEISTEKILQDATKRLEFIINATSSVFTPSAIQSLVLRASNALAIQEASGNLTNAAYAIFEQAGKAPIATAEYTAELVKFANGVLVDGYVPLFRNYPSARIIPIHEYKQKVIKGAEFATLSGAIYENTVPKTHAFEHSIVAQGKTAEIGWMVTDSVQYNQDFRSDLSGSETNLVRTFVIRGYDASDDKVDREGLLNDICTATPVILTQSDTSLVKVHRGMLAIAEELLQTLQSYIDWTPPSHKFVFTGHSIGGSLAILLSILLSNERGASFVRQRVLRVFTYGSPPIFEIEYTSKVKSVYDVYTCPILDAFDLPSNLVYSYNQPWDPIVRLFSEYDPLYPLIDDLGEDGYTPWVSGPSRTLRPILKTILESWEGWPRFRANARGTLGQKYRSVGMHFLLLPDPARYLTDRLVSVNTQVPEIDTVLQISSNEALPALNDVFALDTFTISYVSVAVRSFVHHFYPAYGAPVVDYARKIASDKKRKMSTKI